MASVCISRSVDVARVPIRSNYGHLHKWPESDYEFVKSRKAAAVAAVNEGRTSVFGEPRVVDSFSCRQLYLRSYPFSREEDFNMEEKAIKCLGRIRDKAASGGDHVRRRLRKAKKGSCSALSSVFRRLLACTTKIDVAS